MVIQAEKQCGQIESRLSNVSPAPSPGPTEFTLTCLPQTVSACQQRHSGLGRDGKEKPALGLCGSAVPGSMSYRQCLRCRGKLLTEPGLHKSRELYPSDFVATCAGLGPDLLPNLTWDRRSGLAEQTTILFAQGWQKREIHPTSLRRGPVDNQTITYMLHPDPFSLPRSQRLSNQQLQTDRGPM